MLVCIVQTELKTLPLERAVDYPGRHPFPLAHSLRSQKDITEEFQKTKVSKPRPSRQGTASRNWKPQSMIKWPSENIVSRYNLVERRGTTKAMPLPIMQARSPK